MDLDYNERGSGYWKLNNLYLQEKPYIELINQEIKRTVESCTHKPPLEVWETIKTRIKKSTMEYAKGRTSEDKIVIAQLTEKVCEYQSNFPLNKEEDKMLQNTKQDLEQRALDKARSMIFRSKVKWYEEGELNTKYFFSLEKSRYNAKTCYKVINNKGEELTSTAQILKEQKEFYQELYKEDEHVKFTLSNTHSPCVPAHIQKDQEKQLTLEDLQQSIKKMNNNKTPGEDGNTSRLLQGILATP